MLENIENHAWLILLPASGIVFTATWNALSKHSDFPEFGSFMIALCVAMLFIVGSVDLFPQQHEISQETLETCQESIPLEKPQQHKFHFILLPYLALGMSFVLLLMLVKIGLLADGTGSIFRASQLNRDIRKDPDNEEYGNEISKR